MRKLMSITTLGVSGALTVALLAMSGGAANAGDEFSKRDDETPELVLVADDDDDDTNDGDTRDQDTRDTRSKQSKNTNDNTRSNFTGVSRDRDNSRGDKTKDWTRDGGDKTRDKTAGSTNDRSRNDTRR
ncbi:hypothetical protein [uncultured Nocardioides sp.]|uniref:hypothetical protein n=1 Tax=uncultured Nocardioides sp. TaxID=198441 RepID=UPI00260E06C9|nr:hypothetical protein [uncultured Nocardioides sp.]